jgi:Co/Zn/Cd efflux system component
MIKTIIIFIGAIFILIEQIQKFKKERTASTTALLIVAVVMMVSSIILLVDEFV